MNKDLTSTLQTYAFSGKRTAACVSLKKELDRALFWFPCRRHVGELLLSHCWEGLKVETSASTNILIFQRRV